MLKAEAFYTTLSMKSKLKRILPIILE